MQTSQVCSCLQVFMPQLSGMGCVEAFHAGKIIQGHLLFTGAGHYGVRQRIFCALPYPPVWSFLLHLTISLPLWSSSFFAPSKRKIH